MITRKAGRFGEPKEYVEYTFRDLWPMYVTQRKGNDWIVYEINRDGDLTTLSTHATRPDAETAAIGALCDHFLTVLWDAYQELGSLITRFEFQKGDILNLDKSRDVYKKVRGE